MRWSANSNSHRTQKCDFTVVEFVKTTTTTKKTAKFNKKERMLTTIHDIGHQPKTLC